MLVRSNFYPYRGGGDCYMRYNTWVVLLDQGCEKPCQPLCDNACHCWRVVYEEVSPLGQAGRFVPGR